MEQSPAADLPDSGWVRAPNGAPILRYEIESPGPVLHVEWQHGPPLDDVKHGFQALVPLLREHHCAAIVSDSNGGSGDWSDLIPWVRYEFLPPAIATGLRYLADVLPVDAANSFSVYRWREQTRGLLPHGVFNTLGAARAWVQGQLRAEPIG